MPETVPGRRFEDLACRWHVAIALVVSLLLVAGTGGAGSPFIFTLFLPLVIAALSCSPLGLFVTGLTVGAAHFTLAWLTRQETYADPTPEALRSGTIIAVTLAAGLYARRVRGERIALRKAVAEKELQLEATRMLAATDPMTGLFNFRTFREQLEEETRRAARYGRPLSLIVIDLDGFKKVNDTYGHPAGDGVLSAAVDAIRMAVRATDLPARYGGEEFAVVCPETDCHDALLVGERIRSAVAGIRHEIGVESECRITCSAGVASFPAHARDEVHLIEAADAALYRAKRLGKNRVEAPAPLSAKT